jgi:hypothetical protein
MNIFPSLCLLASGALEIMNKATWIAVLIASVLGAGVVYASPFGLNFGVPWDEGCPFFGNDTLSSIETAIENENYTAWKEALESLITEANFQKLVEMKNQTRERESTMERLRVAWEEGDYETIAEIRASLNETGGMPFQNGEGKGFGKNSNDIPEKGNAFGRLKQMMGKLAFWRR